jgi:hypothetical protein
MATRAAASAAKAIYAEPAFIPKGPINEGRFNLIREICIGFTLGLTGGLAWKVSPDGAWLGQPRCGRGGSRRRHAHGTAAAAAAWRTLLRTQSPAGRRGTSMRSGKHVHSA